MEFQGGAEKIQELETTNAHLRSELMTVKGQLEIALSLTPELEGLHANNRKLTTQISETLQKCENFQSRLKLSQARCSELEYKIQRHEQNEKKMKEECEQLTTKEVALTREMEELKTGLSKLEKELQNERDEKSLFFASFNETAKEDVSDFQHIICVISELKKHVVLPSPKPETPVAAPVECVQCKELQQKVLKNAEAAKLLEIENRGLKEELSKKDRDIKCLDAKFQDVSFMNQTAEGAEDESRSLSCKIEKLKQAKSKLKVDNETILHEIERLKKEVRMKDERIEDLRAKLLQQPVIQKNDELEQILRSQVEQKEQENYDLSERMKQKEFIIKETTDRNKQLVQTLDSVQKAKSNACRQLSALQKEYETITKHYEDRKREQHTALMELKNENSSLHDQLELLQKARISSDSARDEMFGEIETMKKSNKHLSVMMETQKRELEYFTAERRKLIDLLQKQNQLIMRFEAVSSENEYRLSQAIEKANAVQSVDPMAGVLPCVQRFMVPLLEDNVRERVQNAILLDDCTPEERIKQIYGIITSEIKAQRADIIEKDKILEEKKECSDCKSLQVALKTAVYGLQKSLTKETSASDPSLSQIIRYQCKRMVDVLQKTRGTHVSPQKGILEGSPEKRSAVANETGDVSPICSSLVMINLALEEQLKLKVDECVSLRETQKQIADNLGCNESDVVSQVSRMVDMNKRLVARKRSLQIDLAKFKNESEQECDNLTNTLTQRDEQIQKIRSDMNEIEARNEQLASEIKCKENALETIQNYNKELQQIMDTIQASHNDEISQYEDTLNERNREFTEMANKANILANKVETLSSRLKQRETELLNQLQKEQEEHQQQMEHLKSEFATLHAKQNKKFVIKKQKYEEAITKLANQIQSREAAADSQKQLNEQQITELQALSKKLNSSYEESESKVKNLQDQMQRAQKTNANLERKLKAVSEQGERERNIIEARCSCMLMASETKHHEELIQVRNELISKENEMMIRILDAFRALDSIEQDEINETIFEETMTEIAERMRSRACFGM